MFNWVGFISRVLILAGAWFAVASAQSPQPPVDQPDPEDRNHGVARISLMNGDVSVRRGDSGDYVAAQVNAPLLVQDSVQTGQASRAEVQFDDADRLRIGENTEVRVANLTADRYQMQLARGITTFSILRESSAQVEIDTPSVAANPLGRGDYRIAVLEDGTTQISVRLGELQIYSPRGSERLGAGQTMLARGSSENPEFQIVAGLARDEWDQFNERRDRELENSNSYQYVNRDITGAEDLDHYGRWVSDSTYGNVWAPSVSTDWAPYRAGRWVWEDYYGWTWVSSDPWGWAPYHYGNWFVNPAYGWCWYPGPAYRHSWYRPALVGFFGFGGGGVGFGFGGGFGNIGWVPLAPFEVFHPWWGRGYSGGYARGFGGVNIANVNIYNSYRNARFANGVTALSTHDFTSGRFGRYSNPTGTQLSQASAFHGAVPVSPTSQNLRFNDRQTGAFGSRGSSFSQTRFASHLQPGAAAARAPYQQQQGGTSSPGWGRQSAQSQSPGVSRQFANGGTGQFSNTGRTFSGNNSSFGNTSSSFGRQSTPANPNWERFGSIDRSQRSISPGNGGSYSHPSGSDASRGQAAGSGWGRFGNPTQAPGSGQFGNSSRSAPNSSWDRFGAPRSSQQGSFGSSMPRADYGASPQRFSLGSSNNYRPEAGNSRSIQVSPPIVRDRSSSSGFGHSSSPTYRDSAPAYRSPSSTPSYHQSAPNYHQSTPQQSHGSSSGGGGRTSSSTSNNGGGHRGR